ncbi:hypothetical protein PENTCL1PPCAC_15276, partial [Pristionchus entomophagus]
MHRNFRIQLCLATIYYTFQIHCRFILIYYQLNDILPRPDDNLLFSVETIRDAILGYFCAIPGSFALERFFATQYWSWYKKGSPSTLWVFNLCDS